MLNLNVDHKLLTKYIARLLNNQILFANSVDNQPLLKHAVSRFNSLPEDIREMMFENYPSVFRQIKMFEHNIGELKINVPQKGIKIIAIRENKSEQTTKSTAKDEIINISPAPAVNSLKAGLG